MLSLKDIVGLNIEVSSRCNGKCPFCSRNKKKRSYDNHIIGLSDFKKLPNPMFDTLEWVSFGGNFGDFATNDQMPDITAYIKEMNPKIELYGDSNGSVQNEKWWARLGQFFQEGSLFFSLDGLENTHAIHRKGTNFKKIINNVKAFTSAGGQAFWKFILFKHNENQIDEAEKKAKEIGCSRFFVVSSREYDQECQRPEKIKFDLKHEIFSSYQQKTIAENEHAICKPYANQSIYIAADGTVHPCCLAHCMYITDHDPSFKYIVPLIEKNIEKINFKINPLAEIISSSYFENVFKISKTNSYCMLKCNKYKKKAQNKLVLYDKYF